jgi:hypothetical protein
MSDAIDNGGPAFPIADPEKHTIDGLWSDFASGMSLRDWFAGQALTQSVDDYDRHEKRVPNFGPLLPHASRLMTREEIIARQAYRYADAMLAVRKVVS